VDQVTLDVVVADDGGAVAELVPPIGVVLVGAPLVLVALDAAGLDEAGALVLVDDDVPMVGVVDVDVLLIAGVLLGGGVVAGACIGSHFETVGNGFTVPETVLPGEPEPGARGAPTAATEARLCGAIAVLTTNAPVVESKIPPAIRPIDTGRTRAKHMLKDPARALRSSSASFWWQFCRLACPPGRHRATIPTHSASRLSSAVVVS
jgi:hypothetical protein